MDVIITDVTQKWLDLRGALRGVYSCVARLCYQCADAAAPAVDYDKIAARHGRTFLWTKWEYWPPARILDTWSNSKEVEAFAGPFMQEITFPRVSASA